jgi:hypothetical protein
MGAIAPVLDENSDLFRTFQIFPKELPLAAGQSAATVKAHRDSLEWGELR